MYVSKLDIPGVLVATRWKDGKVSLTFRYDEQLVEMNSQQANDLATWIFATDTGA